MPACMNPFIVRNNVIEPTPVPCGKCPNCIARRVSGWSFRIVKEAEQSISSVFLTLTYDTQQVPITPKGYMNLNPTDIRNFIKLIRYYTKKHPVINPVTKQKYKHQIKYYAVGEYGTKYMRPHYHVILLNANISYVQKAWYKGEVHYGTQVSGASVGYCMKYISKPSRVPLHANDDRITEFSRMSKRLGISYLTPQMIKWHMQDLTGRAYIPTEGGNKIAMPRYFRDKLYTEQQRAAIGQVNALRIESELQKQIEQNPDYLTEKAINDAAAYKRMYRQSQHNQKL